MITALYLAALLLISVLNRDPVRTVFMEQYNAAYELHLMQFIIVDSGITILLEVYLRVLLKGVFNTYLLIQYQHNFTISLFVIIIFF